MEIYLRAFINFEQNNWAKVLPMAEFVYNNVKNTSIDHKSFELNYSYHPQAFYQENVNPCFRSKSVNELASKLKELMTICRKNL